MKPLMLCAIILYCIILSDARLILRNTSKPKGDMISNGNVKDISSSREEIDGPEIIHFNKGKVRSPRHNENAQTKNVTRKNTNAQTKSKTALVKKPIPKYKDDSDEDYQSKNMKNRWPSKLADSIEHEDEDFSLDDYDFDVNHDEFIGRGKPLEPRIELKRAMEGSKIKSAQKSKRTPIREVTNVERNNLIKITRKAVYKMKEDDYDDDFPTTVNSVTGDRNPVNKDEDSSDEPESSGEDQVFIRNARSPWTVGTYVDKLGEKTSVMMTKILSFLPLFPQLPEVKKMDGFNSMKTN